MSDNKEMTRREVLKSIGIRASVVVTLPVLAPGAAAYAHLHYSPQSKTRPQPPQLEFFTEGENQTLIEMSERIIPADESSPGAEAARVNEYIDLLVSRSEDSVQESWREGLAAVNKSSRDVFGLDFVAASEDQQDEVLREISRNEESPRSVEEVFFRLMKDATFDGYYGSEIGIHHELRYQGNTFLIEWVGCPHPEHQG